MDGGESDQPLYVSPGYLKDEAITFLGHDGLLDVESHQELIWEILEKCDGQQDRSAIVKQLADKDDERASLVSDIIDDLQTAGVVADSRHAYERFHVLTTNPQLYDSGLSPSEILDYSADDPLKLKAGIEYKLRQPTGRMSELSKLRESSRSFLPKAIDTEQISEILACAYSREIKPVPSAGALYPLRLTVVIKEGSEDLPAGYYQYDQLDHNLILYEDQPDDIQLKFGLNQPEGIHNAPALIVIGADFNRDAGKYANRGYRYAHLEAGHVAQNIHLAVTELGLGSLEYGGFQDSILSKELQLDEGDTPLIVVAFGEKAEQNGQDLSKLMIELDDSLVGPGKPINRYGVSLASEYFEELGFFKAVSHYKPANQELPARKTYQDRYASGTGWSIDQARVKAIAEAYERHSSGLLRVDHVAKAAELENRWLDPRAYAPWSKEQLAHWSNIEPFDPNKEWQWVYGQDALSGESVYVPVDMVFYPMTHKTFGRKLAMYANSSGVAAHVNKELAVQSALLELVERDAIMRNWFSREPAPRIDDQSLPLHWQKRQEYWHSLNMNAEVLDLSEPGAAIAMVTIRNQNHEYPYFVSGCAASTTNFSEALAKAFQESELGMSNALSRPQTKRPNAHTITSPAGHGAYYLSPESAEHIAWLWEGPVKPLPEALPPTDLITIYRPTIIELGLPDKPLTVVRVLSGELTPITFGYMSDYYTHRSINKIGKDYDPAIPHHFA